MQIHKEDVNVIHGDLHAYNLTSNPTNGKLVGILDFESVALEDFHWDFRYLLSWGYLCDRPDFLLQTVLNEYAKLSHRSCSFRRCLLYSAITDFYDLTWRTEQAYPIVGTIPSRLDNSQKLMTGLGLFD